MAEKFPTSTDEEQSSISQTEIRDTETGEILRPQISSRLENNYTSDDFENVTAQGSEVSVPTSNLSPGIQTHITMPACIYEAAIDEETSKMIDTSTPDITQPGNSLCNISDIYSYRQPSGVHSSDSSDGYMSGDSPISRPLSCPQLGWISDPDSIYSVARQLEFSLSLNREHWGSLNMSKLHKNMSNSKRIPPDFERFNQAHPSEISSPKKPSESSSNSFRPHIHRFEEGFPNGSFAGPSKSRTDEFKSSGSFGGVKRKLSTNLPPNNKKRDVHISNLSSRISSKESSIHDNAMETREESQNHLSRLVANTITGGLDASAFINCFTETESEQPANISPKYPCSETKILVSADLNSGRVQSTCDKQIDPKRKFPSNPDLTETRVSKRFRVDEHVDSREPKYSRLETDQTTALLSSSSDPCIQTTLLLDEDISCENSHLQRVDQTKTMEKSKGNNLAPYESYF